MADPRMAMKISDGLFLDNLGNFSKTPPADVPVYGLGGGILSLSGGTRDDVTSGKISLIYNAAEPGWADKLRKLGFDDDAIAFFGKLGDIVGAAVTIVGIAEAAVKVLKLLDIIKSGPSMEELAAKILQKVDIIESMTAEGQENNVKLWLDAARAHIESYRGQVETAHEQLKKLIVVDRLAHRHDMRKKVQDAEGDIRELLKDSRWRLFFRPKHYQWAWGRLAEDLTNPGWWPLPLDHIQRLSDDGKTWIDASFPAPGLRFDPRPALLHVVHGIASYLTMLSMAEPEYRSTGFGRIALVEFADSLAGILKEMRNISVRTVFPAWAFGWEIPSDCAYKLGGLQGFVRPFNNWKAGATDLCSGTDAHYLSIAAQSPSPLPQKLGTLDWDWVPNPVDLVWHAATIGVSGGVIVPAHWKIADPQGAANQANAQSERDYAVLLQTNGFLDLARLEAALRHLATDPDRSETVAGFVYPQRQWAKSGKAKVTGWHGLFCDEEEVTATVSVDWYRTTMTARVELQPPDRPVLLPTRFFLAAYSADVESAVWASIHDQKQLADGVQTVTLSAVHTFDWWIRFGGPSIATAFSPKMVNPKVLLQPKTQPSFFTSASPFTFPAAIEAVLPGVKRNEATQPMRLRVEVTRSQSASSRSASVSVTPDPVQEADLRSFEHVYVVVEETLYSGKQLRTYFNVAATPVVYWVPNWLFEAEERCIETSNRILKYINEKYAIARTILPPNVPVEGVRVAQLLDRVRAEMPDAVERAVRELGLPPVRR